jgi:hypothetical protein
MLRNETKWQLKFIGLSKPWHSEAALWAEDLHIDVALLSETHLTPHKRYFIPNCYFHRTDSFPGRKDIPHNHVDLCYMCDTHAWQRRSQLMRDKPILLYIKSMTARVQLQKKKDFGRYLGGLKPRWTDSESECLIAKLCQYVCMYICICVCIYNYVHCIMLKFNRIYLLLL